jgi:hypothetical protein
MLAARLDATLFEELGYQSGPAGLVADADT